MTPPIIGFFVALAALLATNPASVGHGLVAHQGLGLILAYIVGFGLAPLYAFVYWLEEDTGSLPPALAHAHAYNVYAYLWFPAGRAPVRRAARGPTTWWKARAPAH